MTDLRNLVEFRTCIVVLTEESLPVKHVHTNYITLGIRNSKLAYYYILSILRM